MLSLLKRSSVARFAGIVGVVCLVAAPVIAGVLSIPFFSQRDSRWSYLGLGTSSTDTIGAKGCALTCMAMALKFRGADVDPGKLNRWLADNNGFANQTDIRWDVAAGYRWTCWMRYDGAPSLSSVADLKAKIDGRKLVIVRSHRFGTNSHFAIIRGYTGTGTQWSDFVYWDPWDTTATSRTVGDGWVNSGNSTRVFSY